MTGARMEFLTEAGSVVLTSPAELAHPGAQSVFEMAIVKALDQLGVKLAPPEPGKGLPSDPGRIVPPHGSGPGGPAWQPPK